MCSLYLPTVDAFEYESYVFYFFLRFPLSLFFSFLSLEFKRLSQFPAVLNEYK